MPHLEALTSSALPAPPGVHALPSAMHSRVTARLFCAYRRPTRRRVCALTSTAAQSHATVPSRQNVCNAVQGSTPSLCFHHTLSLRVAIFRVARLQGEPVGGLVSPYQLVAREQIAPRLPRVVLIRVASPVHQKLKDTLAPALHLLVVEEALHSNKGSPSSHCSGCGGVAPGPLARCSRRR